MKYGFVDFNFGPEKNVGFSTGAPP